MSGINLGMLGGAHFTFDQTSSVPQASTIDPEYDYCPEQRMPYSIISDVEDRDEHSTPKDLTDLLFNIGTHGIDVGASKLEGKQGKFLESGEDIELNPSPSDLEKNDDPVRIYLRQMAMVPLLTREGEVSLAKCI